MEMPATYDACHSVKKCIIFVLVLGFLLVKKLTASWVEAGVEYEAGNRRRLISIIRMECLLTLCNFFIYCQLMAYYDENGLVKCDRRLLARNRDRASKLLIVFMFLSQMVYFLYVAPYTFQYLFFDVCALISGIWTNLLGFVLGFFLINCLIQLLDRIQMTKFIVEKIYSIRYIGPIISDRKLQIKVALVVTAVMSALMWYSSDKIVVKEVTIPVQDFSGAEGGVRIALVSDVHTGASVYTQQIEMVVDTLYDLDVDVVALVGDLVDGPVEKIGDRVTPLWRLAQKFPTYFVSGNHEYYYGDVRKWFHLYRSHHIRVLDNACEMFKNICIIGVNDIASEYSGIHGHHMNLSTAMENCTVRSSRVVLAHNPASVLEFSKNDLEKVDVVLSGHTHAAQYYVLVPLIFQVLPYFHGLYDLPYGHGKLFVSAGTLYQGAPMKMLRMSEIWIVNLVRKTA
ncbi:hypothetical protein RB195_004869 [Necator americanus]